GIFSPYLMRWLTLTSGRTSNQKLFAETSYWNQKYRERYLGHIPFQKFDTLVGNPSPHFQKWLKHYPSVAMVRQAEKRAAIIRVLRVEFDGLAEMAAS